MRYSDESKSEMIEGNSFCFLFVCSSDRCLNLDTLGKSQRGRRKKETVNLDSVANGDLTGIPEGVGHDRK